MSKRCIGAAVDYIAGGIDPEKATIFIQSHVKAHAELSWIFNSVTPLGQLMRMTQFKAKTQLFTSGDDTVSAKDQAADKSDDQADRQTYDDSDTGRSEFLKVAGKVNSGLLTYPVLQAADILLYKATEVPVGEDQVQHIELTRDIARRFNNRFGEIFSECRPLLSEASRVLGLDGVNKMSKSIGNHLPMSLTAEELTTRVTKEAASDPSRQKLKDPGHPEICNVFSWHRIFSSEDDLKWAETGCKEAGIGCFHCKKKVAENISDMLAGYREKREELLLHPDDVKDILRDGANRCNTIAKETMEQVREKLGLVKPFA